MSPTKDAAPETILPPVANFNDRDDASVLSNLTDAQSTNSPKRGRKSFMDKFTKKPELSIMSGVMKGASVKSAKEELAKVAHAVDHLGEKLPSRPNSVELRNMVQGGVDTLGADLEKVGRIVEHFPGDIMEKVAEIDLVPGQVASTLKGMKNDYMPEIKVDGNFNLEIYSNEAAKKAAKKEARRKKKEKRDAKLKAKEEKRLAKIQEMNDLAEQKRQQEEDEFEAQLELELQMEDAKMRVKNQLEHEDAITKLMRERNENSAEALLAQRQLALQEEEEAVKRFQPTADIIDSLILDVSLAAARPSHISKQITSSSKRLAAPAAAGLSNFARGSRSSKAGDVNHRERKSIVEMGGIRPLAESLEETNGEFLMTCAADALANLAVDEASRKAVGDSKAIEKLVSILGDAAHPDSDPKEKLSELSEYAAMCLRNLALEEHNAQKMAEFGAIPALIQLSADALPVTRGMCACCLACIAKDKFRCEQICDYGAAGPLIKMLSMKEEVCQLSAVGCLNELSRLRRNKLKISHMGGFEELLRILELEGDFLLHMVQEKAIAIVLSMCEEKSLRKHAVECGSVKAAIKMTTVGNWNAKVSGAWILVHLKDLLTEEEKAMSYMPIAKMIDAPQWPVKSAAASAIMNLYDSDEQRIAFVNDTKVLKRLMNMLSVGDPRVHENTLGAILALMENAEVPDMLIALEPCPNLVRMIFAINLTVRKLAFCVLKCLSIYDLQHVLDNVPLTQHYHIEHPAEELSDYIKMFVEKRKKNGYLSRVSKLGEKFTEEEMKEYEALFAELDEDSSGSIDAEEISILVQALGGKKLDDDELQKLIDEVDKDGSGVIEWDEFLVIMDGIKNGKNLGIAGLLGSALKQGFKRSVLGKGVTKFSNYYNRKKIELEEFLHAEEKEKREAEERKLMAEKYWEAERVKRERLRMEENLVRKLRR